MITIKEKILFFITLLVLLTLLFSSFIFASAEAPDAETAEAEYEAAGVDELLAAIGPDRTIRLTGKDYLLSSASDYGRIGEHGFYHWNEVYDGYELEIDNVSNMKIISECGSSVAVEPRYAAVLRFSDCEGVEISGITAGHTTEPGFCDAGVVVFEKCRECLLSSCSLYGCGSIGLYANDCAGIKITESEIYSCRIYAVQLNRCRNAEIDACRIHDFDEAECLFSFSSCSAVQIKRCDISKCSVYSLLSPGYSYGVYFTANSVKECVFRGQVFNLEREIVVDACEFKDCGQVFWYSGEVRAVDGTGKELRKADFTAMTLGDPISPAIESDAPHSKADPSGCYYVATVDEFLAAIGPNRTIVLTEGMYDLSTASLYGAYGGQYYYWYDDYDGPGLVIQNVENLTIKSSDGDAFTHCISAIPRYADVIEFVGCEGLYVEGVTLGHTQQPGSCSGGVIRLDNCNNSQFYNCRMYGCGILGIDASNCARLRVESCDIYDCSEGGVWLYCCDNARFDGCSYDDLGGPAFSLTYCEDVYIENMPVSNGFFNVTEKGPTALGYG